MDNIPGRHSNATHILHFNAENIPPLSSKYFKIEKTPQQPKISYSIKSPSYLSYDEASEILTIHDGNKDVKINTDLRYYEGFSGFNQSPDDRASGAYIFR